ncbi:ricin-type beta-trefoil lectin domain protein [Streptomyces sp. NPDC048331]|uniref:ricin-type beta-trefoil lectin domain protein n=1 Tax=Streptomyces sp. NPDC048331 TaxID=3365534 RepID=UPI00370FF72E
MSDQHLCAALRAEAPAAPAAEAELLRRHGPRVIAFARTVDGDPSLGPQAADRAMKQFLRMRAGADDDVERPPRLSLLMLLPSSEAESAAGATSDPALQPVVRQGFTSLPFRTQALLWHSVVEREPDDRVAAITGDRPEAVPDLTRRALSACRDAFLREHLRAPSAPHCPRYARMLDAAAARADVRDNPDLARHIGGCPGCAAALRGLVALGETPGPLLAGALLGEPGRRYAEARARTGADAEDTLSLPVVPALAQLPQSAGADRRRTAFFRRSTGRVVLGAAAVLAAAATAAFALGPDEGPRAPRAEQADAPDLRVGGGEGEGSPVPTKIGARPSASASARPLPSASPTATGPSPGQDPTTSPTVEAAASPEAVRPFRAATFVQAVNSASGLCLDVRGGALASGTDVVTARCRPGDAVQQWRLDGKGLLRNAADPRFCLDSRGASSKGVGIWTCSAYGKSEGDNLVFSMDATGRIKPRTAPGYAVTASGGAPGAAVTFGRTGPAAEQLWTEPAGSTATPR